MHQEQDLIPYAATPPPAARAVVVFAPHADDEVFGCGGALALYRLDGIPVEVFIVTDGAFRADASALRLEESRQAAAVLGYGAPQCWGLPDRGLAFGDDLVVRCQQAIERAGADVVFAPGFDEVHPDHRIVAEVAAAAVRRLGGDRRLVLYEVGRPLTPTHLVDISAVRHLKRQAMRCFASQLAHQAYDEQVDALNRYRAYTLPPEVGAAEAFAVLPAAALAELPVGAASGSAAQLALRIRLEEQLASILDAAGIAGATLPERVAAAAAAAGRLRELEATARTAEAQYAAVVQSRSWALTAPLRRLARLFRG